MWFRINQIKQIALWFDSENMTFDIEYGISLKSVAEQLNCYIMVFIYSNISFVIVLNKMNYTKKYKKNGP